MPRKLLAANWKENPDTEARALALFRGIAEIPRAKGLDVVICPPFIYLEEISRAYKNLKKKNRPAFGAQDVFWEEQGPYTSEVGPKMLRSLGVEYVIIGHSERRRLLKETDAMINRKIKLALADGLRVILCVGEASAVRRKGIATAKNFVGSQLSKDLKDVSPKAAQGRLAVAYEPIWAIGTGRSDNPKDADEMAGFIREKLRKSGRFRNVNVLYGGSVSGKNIRSYMIQKNIGGALVGGAGLHADEFKKIMQAVTQ